MINKIRKKFFEYNDFFEEYFIKEEFYEKHKIICRFIHYISDKFIL